MVSNPPDGDLTHTSMIFALRRNRPFSEVEVTPSRTACADQVKFNSRTERCSRYTHSAERA